MTAASPTAASRRRPTFDPWAPIWRILTSVRVAVLYISLLALFGLLGVVIPQIPEAMRGNDAAVQAWIETKRDTFGPLTDPMYRAGLFSVFQARWFLFALAFLVLFVTTCTLNRWSPTFRNVFRPPARVPDRFFESAHNRAVFDPAPSPRVRDALAAMRFGRIDAEQRDGATYIFADRYPWAQLATFVSHLALILFLAGGLVSWATGFTANRFAGEGSVFPVFAVSDPGQIQVRIDDAVGRYGESGNPLDFRTHLTLFRNGQEVKSGVTTVNDPLAFEGYRFHQVAFFPYGAALRIRDAATGNTVFNETFPLEETIAAPVVTVRNATGAIVLADTIAPTDFLDVASGTTLQPPGGPVIWLGLTALDEERWQLVAFDPAAGDSGDQLRMDEGASGELSGMTIAFDDVVALPAALGVDIPGGSGQTLAQLAGGDGDRSLLLVSAGQPAISLAPGEPAIVGGYEYVFEGSREFAGISVKRDSGAWFIWIATGMLVIGLGITFYVPRRRLWIRITPERTQIAALAEKSGGFEKDMRILARKLGVPVPAELQEES